MFEKGLQSYWQRPLIWVGKIVCAFSNEPSDAQHCNIGQEGEVADRLVKKQKAPASFGRWSTKAELDAKLKGATPEQQTLTSIFAQSTAAMQVGSASGQGTPKQPRSGFLLGMPRSPASCLLNVSSALLMEMKQDEEEA